MTHKASILYLFKKNFGLECMSFWMSLKSTFLAFKKSCKSCPNWEGGGNLDKIQKNSNILSGCLPWVRQKIRQLLRKTIFDDDHRKLKPFCERKKVFFTLLWHLFPSIHAISWMFLASASPLTPSSSSQLPWSSSSCYYHFVNFVIIAVMVNNIVQFPQCVSRLRALTPSGSTLWDETFCRIHKIQ